MQRAAELLRSATKAVVIGHIRPDADAIGSIGGIIIGLEKLGIPCQGLIGQTKPIPENMLSIPRAETITCTETLPEADLVVIVDCGSIDRTGTLAEQVAAHPNTLVLDHHASNTGFGKHNVVRKVESTTSLIAQLFEEMGIELDVELAHALYAGLVTDTGSFRWGSSGMHLLAAKLMDTGLNVRTIGEELMDNTTVRDTRRVGAVLANLRTYTVGDIKVGVLVANHGVISTCSDAAVESLVDAVRALDGVELGVVLKENDPDIWSVSLRSTSMNVAEIAVKLGGGGHIPAAGYTARGDRDRVLKELLANL